MHCVPRGLDRLALIGRKTARVFPIRSTKGGADILISKRRSVIQAMGGELRVQARLRDRDWVTWNDDSHSEKELVDT